MAPDAAAEPVLSPLRREVGAQEHVSQTRRAAVQRGQG